MGALIVLLVLPVDYHLNSPHLVNAVQLGGDSPLVVSQDIGLQLSQSLGELELVCVSEEEVADGGNSLGPGRVTTGINDIDDEVWFRQPQEGVTHVAWQVGKQSASPLLRQS